MRTVSYSMSASVDGYIAGPDGDFAWGAPDEQIFQLATDEVREAGVHLMGRRLYESMLFWEDNTDEPTSDYSTAEFATLWRALPKVVFSTTLSTVRGNARLATASVAEEIERLRAEPTNTKIAIGGATLAAAAAADSLIDEYRVRVYPVLVGGGVPYFAHDERREDLDLVETRPLPGGVVYLHYRVRRDEPTPS